MRKLFPLTFLFILLISCEDHKVNIFLNLKKGQTYNQTMTKKETVTQTVNGQPETIITSITRRMAYLVKGGNNDNYNMEAKYKRLSIGMEFPRDTFQFNSEQRDGQDTFSTVLSKVTDQPFFIKLKKDGEVKDIRGIDSLFISMFAEYPQLSGNNDQNIEAALLREFGSKALTGGLGRVVAIFPDNPVAKGDTWAVITHSEAAGGTSMKFTYQYKGRIDSNYLIHVNAVIKNDNNSYVKTSGLTGKYNLSGALSSDIQVNKATGWITEAQINEMLKGTSQIKGNLKKIPEGKPTPISFKTEITISDR
ncbi:MAG TPA: DUF6263 family protein [Chitinophagaceae bacterium]|nr:DUF6263 family protein [Chitinophagaceae bacterium]